ncbi:Spy/CpxP family protein refolding chaperone [Legionella sp. 227]|uniref:Spy/CpxP family protein refolding chaperone n=1 Tax=Legionella sp. 227 TaxID=3367288 RepID=UPI00370DC6CB
MSKKILWLSTVVFVLTFGQPSFACIGGSKHCNSHHRLDRLAQELNLTADQKAKIKAYKEKARAAFKENYGQLRLLRSQINSMIQSNKIDEAKLDSLIEKISKIRGSMLKSRIMMQHQMFSLLNEKQKAKFLELKKKWYLKRNA